MKQEYLILPHLCHIMLKEILTLFHILFFSSKAQSQRLDTLMLLAFVTCYVMCTTVTKVF